MKKIIYPIIILLSLLSIAKALTLPSATINIENSGGKTLYYAFQDSNQYSDTLCYSINGWSTKSQVSGTILPFKSKTLIFTPLTNYRALCTRNMIQGFISFGITPDGATYDIDNIYILTNFTPMYFGNAIQYWQIMPSSTTVISQSGYNFGVDSDNNAFTN